MTKFELGVLRDASAAHESHQTVVLGRQNDKLLAEVDRRDKLMAIIHAERDMALAEIERLRAGFMHHLMRENDCSAQRTGKPCEAGKCGCEMEMEFFLNQQRTNNE